MIGSTEFYFGTEQEFYLLELGARKTKDKDGIYKYVYKSIVFNFEIDYSQICCNIPGKRELKRWILESTGSNEFADCYFANKVRSLEGLVEIFNVYDKHEVGWYEKKLKELKTKALNTVKEYWKDNKVKTNFTYMSDFHSCANPFLKKDFDSDEFIASNTFNFSTREADKLLFRWQTKGNAKKEYSFGINPVQCMIKVYTSENEFKRMDHCVFEDGTEYIYYKPAGYNAKIVLGRKSDGMIYYHVEDINLWSLITDLDESEMFNKFKNEFVL